MNNESLNTKNYFNDLINNQIVQQASFNNSFNNKKNNQVEQVNQNNNQTTTATKDTSLFDNLSNLLLGTQQDTQEQDVLYSINKLLDSGASIESIANLLTSLTEDKGDILYTRTTGEDPYITLQNKIKYIGGDLKAFLAQALNLSNKGGNINDYINTVSKILDRGDYDDLRRFIDVVNDALSKNYNVSDLLEYSNESLEEDSENFEMNMFSFQTLFQHGANLDDSIEILRNMDTAEYEGKQNMSVLDSVLVKAEQMGEDMNSMISNMALSGDTNWFIDEWAFQNNLTIIKPKLDYDRFKKIDFLDKKKDLVIHQGDNVALYAKAISSQQGMLDDSVLNWSSTQTGAISSGNEYLDLSKLDKGCYDIYVKIGEHGEGDGTDTAKRRVIVLGKDEKLPEDEDEKETKGCSKKKGKNFGKSKEGLVITKIVQGTFISEGELQHILSNQESNSDNTSKNDNVIKNNKETEKLEKKDSNKDEDSVKDKEKQELYKLIKKDIEDKYQENKVLNQEESDKKYQKTQEFYKESSEKYYEQKEVEKKEVCKVF